jgi:hypothetical protein
VAKDVTLEIRQLVQRGLDHHENGRSQDALSDWETAQRLGPGNLHARRLVAFGRQRVSEIEAGEHPSRARRDTLKSPIPQFLAALTERKSDKVTIPVPPLRDGPVVSSSIDDNLTPDNDWGIVTRQHSMDGLAQLSLPSEDLSSDAPDTLEDLHVHAEDLRASAGELIGECRAALNDNRADPAALAADLALHLAERAPPPGVDDLIEPSRALFERAFRACMGNPHACPIRAIPTETLSDHGLDQRAALLMSRMDGMTSLADLIDSSGMPRFDAVRILAALRRGKAIDILPPLQ